MEMTSLTPEEFLFGGGGFIGVHHPQRQTRFLLHYPIRTAFLSSYNLQMFPIAFSKLWTRETCLYKLLPTPDGEVVHMFSHQTVKDTSLDLLQDNVLFIQRTLLPASHVV